MGPDDFLEVGASRKHLRVLIINTGQRLGPWDNDMDPYAALCSKQGGGFPGFKLSVPSPRDCCNTLRCI